MKLRSNHIIVLVGLAIFLFVVAVALRDRGSQSEEDGGRADASSREPRIELETDHLDMGVISNKGPSSVQLEVRNTGGAPLEILSLAGSCPNCISATLETPVIRPGASTTMTVIMNPFYIPGFETSKSISITSNDPGRRIVVLPVVCQVEPEFSIEPEAFTFGDVQKGQTVEQTMILRQVGDDSVVIENILVNPPPIPGLEFEHHPLPEADWQDPGKPEHAITARIHPEIPLGELGVVFRIMTNIERLDTGLASTVTATVHSFYSVEPQQLLQLGTVNPGQKEVATVVVRGDTPISVNEIDFSVDSLTAHVRSDDDPTIQYIDVSVADAAREGRIRGELTFRVYDGQNSARHTLEIFGLARLVDAA